MSTFKRVKVFSGIRTHGATAVHHEFFVDKHRMPLCQGKLYEDVGCVVVDGHTKLKHTYAWGYDGPDPELTAVTILAISLGAPDDDAGGRETLGAFSDWSGNGLGYYDEEKLPMHKDWFDLIKKHYRQFTAEIVANFGDTWEITTEEILAWIKEKES